MKKTFNIEYDEFEPNDIYDNVEDYILYQDIFQKLTIRDVKEYVKEKRYKAHKPVCTCFLEIYIRNQPDDDVIHFCDYDDSIVLDDTVFNENNHICVCASIDKRCNCGELEKLTFSSNFEKLMEEKEQKWEEKERQNKKYYDKRIREEKNHHQLEINRLQNLINQHERQNTKNMRNQNQQHQKEIERIQLEKNRIENELNAERKSNKEKFKNIKLQMKQERNENLERLQTLENERNQEREENLKKFENYEQEINKERESNTKKFNYLENTLKEKEEQLRMNTEALQKNEQQKKFQKKCQNDAENEFLSQINKIYENYYENNKQSVYEEIYKDLNELMNKKIVFKNINEESIFKIVKNEKFQKIIREYFDDKLANLNDEYTKIDLSSINIIILGNTGVGKSTLLNTVLKEKLAKTDLCNACTMGVPKPYKSQKTPGICVYDSRGIENGKYNLDTAFKDIKNTIESLIKNNEPDKFIHCIWYCININSNRFTEEEIINLEKCYDSYIEKLPIIVVFTQSYNQIKTAQMMEMVKSKIRRRTQLDKKL